MNVRRSAIAAVAVIAVFLFGIWRSGPAPGKPAFVPEKSESTKAASVASNLGREVVAEDLRFLTRPESDPSAGFVGAGLNQVGGRIERDLAIVDEVLAAWQTNFPGQGNPVGLNAEITASLTGQNRLRLDLIPADHPAINEAGELCDRWGSPFVFHQISGDNMELRSAGPDRVAYTEDDVVFNPAGFPAE